jgi:hypothetical protein
MKEDAEWNIRKKNERGERKQQSVVVDKTEGKLKV